MLKLSLLLMLAVCFLAVNGHTQKKAGPSGSEQAVDTTQVQQLLGQGSRLEKTHADSAEFYYNKAVNLALGFKDKHLLVTCMDREIRMLNNAGRFEDALNISQQHIELANQLHDKLVQLQAYNEAANEYEYLGDYEPSTEFYLKALELANAVQDKTMQRKINNNIGSVFLALKDYRTGYTYSSRAYQMALEGKDTATMGNCVVNMGIAELYQKKYQEALFHFREAEQIGQRIPDMTLVADALSDKGLVYLTTHRLNAAAASYHEQKSIADRYDLPYEKLYSLFQLALVEKEKGNLTTADKYASFAISIGERLGTSNELMEMYDSMAAIKQKLGQFKSALDFKNKYISLYDSLNNQQVQTNIHHLNIRYRSAQKDRQIAEQQLRIERSKAAIDKKNAWIIMSLAGILALAIILVLSYRSYWQKRKLHRQQLITLQREHEVNTLQAKMQAREEERNRIAREMHDDIGSALTTILYLSNDLETREQRETAKSAKKISVTAASVVDKMNEIIWSMNPDYDSINDLIAYIRQYCAEFLSDHGVGYHLTVPEKMEQLALGGEQRRNIFLVIKEALHNIVKHAAATDVSIDFAVRQQDLTIRIRDNGRGYDGQSAFGNGLKNMQHRMEVIGGRFTIMCDNGTLIRLVCPLASGLSA